MSAMEFKRVLLADLCEAEALGWTPAITRMGAVGVSPFSAGLGAEVLVQRPLGYWRDRVQAHIARMPDGVYICHGDDRTPADGAE